MVKKVNYFKPNALRIELDHFLYKRQDLKKQSLNAQLGAAVAAGVMSYTDMVRYRDFVQKQKDSK